MRDVTKNSLLSTSKVEPALEVLFNIVLCCDGRVRTTREQCCKRRNFNIEETIKIYNELVKSYLREYLSRMRFFHLFIYLNST